MFLVMVLGTYTRIFFEKDLTRQFRRVPSDHQKGVCHPIKQLHRGGQKTQQFIPSQFLLPIKFRLGFPWKLRSLGTLQVVIPIGLLLSMLFFVSSLSHKDKGPTYGLFDTLQPIT